MPGRQQLFWALLGLVASVALAFPTSPAIVAPCVLAMVALGVAALRWPRVLLGEEEPPAR